MTLYLIYNNETNQMNLKLDYQHKKDVIFKQ